MPCAAERPGPATSPASDAPQPALRQAAAEKNRGRLPRPSKNALLPHVGEVAEEGHSGRKIAARLGLPKSTVNRWLQEPRAARRRKVAENPAIIADAVAHYESVYRESMEAFYEQSRMGQVAINLLESTQYPEERQTPFLAEFFDPLLRRVEVQTSSSGRKSRRQKSSGFSKCPILIANGRARNVADQGRRIVLRSAAADEGGRLRDDRQQKT